MGNSLAKQNADQGLGLYKFRLLRVIGRGSFGKVRMVEHRPSSKTYALKYINKATCIANHAHGNTLRERDMLEEIDHPFVANLRFSFQDECSMFMVMDLMIGGDLRFHIMRRRFFEGVIRFWVAELACALNHLHFHHGIVHRDVKPDNILMDHQGHVALTDFNIATRIVNGAPHYAVAGTANYMAPEVVSGVGYTYSVDWWSLGVVMYECVYGRRPFRHKKNTDSLKHALLHDEIQFPIVTDVQVSYECVSLMRGLLNKDPELRLGCGPKGFAALKAHPFFAPINWPQLEAKRSVPPFAPNNDLSNFDISHDIEEMLLEPDPLLDPTRRRNRQRRAPPEHATPEYQLLSRSFSTFDYIEYERFKTYLDIHGSITTLAMEDARAARASASTAASTPAHASDSPALIHLRLDDRPIVNLDAQSTLSYSVTLSRSRAVLQQQHTILSDQPAAASVDASSGSTPATSLRQRLSDAKRRGSSSAQPLSDLRGPHAHGSSNSSNSTATAIPADPQASVNTAAPEKPGTLEPPSIVPIDILTWNQLLPSQRSLAHRYCIKRTHDRIRRSTASTVSRNSSDCGLHKFPQLATRLDRDHVHRHAPSGSMCTANSAALVRNEPPLMATGVDNCSQSSSELLSAKEKRASLMRRQLSVDNVVAMNLHASSNYLPLGMHISSLMAPVLDSGRRSPHSIFASTDDGEANRSQLFYSHQPLPPPPPTSSHIPATSAIAIPDTKRPIAVSGVFSLDDAPQCPLPQPPPPPPPKIRSAADPYNSSAFLLGKPSSVL
ncbi:kinase-like protein [Coemansia reversa NRRL 1564]|uniref:Kinase-like protein n=1 Tax=Coemansia reversa (strain ATCC 12441 / NRRL 1564) TaxID=763665 RepID=A0A2G5B5A0_COERN|nr:kinase-like protein [Coemansia reversa NRRL 1564]|eukprot:PIA14185.1 kinase-like protein [Coemansia reversa NRRL 1564]